MDSTASKVNITENGLGSGVSTFLSQANFQSDRATVFPAPVTLPSGAVFTPPPRTYIFSAMSADDQATVKAQMDFWAAKYSADYGKAAQQQGPQ
jgi:hypothetical protein